MFYIVGLGNPGEKYANSRHNAGWRVLDFVLAKSGLPKKVGAAKYAADISEGTLADRKVLFLFPTTFMNNSGVSIMKALSKKEEAGKVIVIYDDVDLPIGEMKISFGRGSGGHNGLQSVIDVLGTKDFTRIRIGIASKTFFGSVKRPKGEALTRHVLGTFNRKEEKQLDAVGERVDLAMRMILREGVEKAMQEFN